MTEMPFARVIPCLQLDVEYDADSHVVSRDTLIVGLRVFWWNFITTRKYVSTYNMAKIRRTCTYTNVRWKGWQLKVKYAVTLCFQSV